MPGLLIIDDEEVLARNIAKTFARDGYTTAIAGTLAEARRALTAQPPDVVLLDLRLPDGSGLDLLDSIVDSDPALPVLMMTAYGSIADAVGALQRGARDYVQKPLDLVELRVKVETAVRAARQHREISYYRERGTGAGTIFGDSPAAERLRTLVERLGRMTAGASAPAPTILLLGETGSGKGHAARAIHAASGGKERPFIELNCTALPENLIESELFGHEKGAFTDARTARAGLIETAEGGTLFLDEIGHVSFALQAKLLKVIEEKTVRRVGASASRRINVQFVAATNRDLEAAVKLGEFREDLYQRLSVAVIRIPPLRERPGDATLLARELLGETCRRYGAAPRALSPDAEAAIERYAWPGNVRELANTMERLVLFSDSNPVLATDLGLPDATAEVARIGVGASGEIVIDFPDTGISLEAVERALLERALGKTGGNRSSAARLLGISRDTLRYRLEKYGLEG